MPMLELRTIDGAPTAIVSESHDVDDVELITDIESLWLTPASSNFELNRVLHLPKLRTLFISKCHQPLLDMLAKETLMGLRTFVATDSACSLNGIMDLGALSNLKTLKLRKQQMRNDIFPWVCQQRALTSLAMTDTDVDDSVIANLGCKNKLKRLDLFRTVVSFRDRQLYGDPFPFVRSLDVSGTGLSGDSVEVIRSLFPRLQRLLAHRTELSESDVRRIAEWEDLKILSTDTPDIDFDRTNDEFWDL